MGALIKIGQLLPGPLQRRVESFETAVRAPQPAAAEPVALATLTTLARASRDSERARFDYRGRGDATSRRHVEPHHVLPLDRRWYLVAWDLDRDDWRTFRLDRIDDPSTTNRRFTPRPIPAADAETYVREKISSLRSVHTIELVVDTPIEAVQRHLGPWGSATEVDPDTTRIEMRIPDLGWAVLMLAVLDVDVHRVEPPELRALLARLAHRFLSVTDPVDQAG